MMFVGNADRESDCVRMWDLRTTRIVVPRDVVWLKRMLFKDDVSGVVELDTPGELEDNLGLGLGSDTDCDVRQVGNDSGPNN